MQDQSSFDRVLYAGSLVTVGAFRLAADHPRFEDAGPIHDPTVVFPRTSCVIEQEGRRSFVTDTNSVVYYNGGQAYRRERDDPRGDLCDWFQIRGDVLRELLGRHDHTMSDRPDDRVFPFGLGPSDADTFLGQRVVIRHLEESAESDTLFVEELVLGIVDRVTAAAPWPSSGEGVSEGGATGDIAASVVRRILRSSFRESLTLEDIATQAGVSPFHMCRQFRAATGTTIHRYRTQLRMREALALVADPAADLTDVALHLGYSSHSHFTATFRETFDTTPSEFRGPMSSGRVDRMVRSLEPILARESDNALRGLR